MLYTAKLHDFDDEEDEDMDVDNDQPDKKELDEAERRAFELVLKMLTR